MRGDGDELDAVAVELLRRLPGVKHVHVDPQDGRIIIDYAPSETGPEDLLSQLSEQERSVIRSSTNWLTD